MKKTLMIILCIILVGCQIVEDDSMDETNDTLRDESMIAVEEVTDNPMRAALGQADFLKTRGKNIYNQAGQGSLVQLKGVNLGGYLFQEFWMTPTKASDEIHDETELLAYLTEHYGQERQEELIQIYQDNYFTTEDFDRLHELGINLIRLPFWYRNIVDGQGQVKEKWYERFDWFLEEAGQRGIYVILDFHGAPGSQNGSDHSGLDGGEDKFAASQFFYGDPDVVQANQALYYDIWVLLADRYKNNPVVAGYDLLNEPYCTYRYTSGLPVSTLHEDLWTVYDEAYHRIRAVDPDHIIIMEATWDPVDLPHPDEYGWTNVVYQYHNYLYDDYDNDKGQQIANMKKKMTLIAQANYPVPSYMGEFSFFNSYEAWAQGVELLNNAGLHWTSWTYKVTYNYGNWGLYHHNSGEANPVAVSDEILEKIWMKVGDSRPNRRLIDVLKPIYLKEAVGAE